MEASFVNMKPKRCPKGIGRVSKRNKKQHTLNGNGSGEEGVSPSLQETHAQGIRRRKMNRANKWIAQQQQEIQIPRSENKAFQGSIAERSTQQQEEIHNLRAENRILQEQVYIFWQVVYPQGRTWQGIPSQQHHDEKRAAGSRQ